MAYAATFDARRRSTSSGTVYTVVWACLALGASAYLAALTLMPGAMFPKWRDASADVEQHVASMERMNARLMTEVVALKSNVGELTDAMAAIKSEAAQTAETARALADKLAALGSHAGPGALPVSAADASAKALLQRRPRIISPQAAAAPAAAPQAAAATPADPPASIASFAGVKTTTVFETGSIAKGGAAGLTNSLAPPPAAGAEAARAFGLQIGAASSVDALRGAWSAIKVGNAQTLSGLQPRYIQSGSAADATPYKLMAGPISGADDAKRACASLQAQGVGCRVTTFSGNALE